MIDFILWGHTWEFAIRHEAWHYVLSLSFSSVLLLAAYCLSRAMSFNICLATGTKMPMILMSFFLLSVSLAFVWHYILDITTVSRNLRFWW